MTSREFAIGEMAAHFGVAAHVLRHWEDVGLLEPARRTGGQRRYTQEDAMRIATILFGKDAQLSLEQVRTGMLSEDVAARHAVLQRCLELLDERIARAVSAKAVIEYALLCHTPEFLECPKYRDAVRSYDPRVDFR